MVQPEPDLTPLRPLAEVIAETVRTTPIRLCPGGTDDLISNLTVKVAAYVGREVLPDIPPAPAPAAQCCGGPDPGACEPCPFSTPGFHCACACAPKGTV